MALTGSGTISLSDIRDEFSPGSNTPVSFDDYYRGGTKVRSNAGNNTATNLAANVPTSGAISLNSFYSQARGWQKTFSSNATQQSGSGIFGSDYSVDYPKYIVINSGVTVYSTSTSSPALDLASGGAGSITVTNNGNLYGQGGAAGSAGGTALKADVATTLVNNSGANIKGGGGGGGNGGAGGKGSAAATATASNVTDKVGDKPDFVPYTVLTQFGPRAWSGIGSGQWGLNTSGNQLRSNISNRGPVWYSFRVNTSAEYSLSSYITDPFPEDQQTGHRGTPVVNISTAEDTKSQGQGGADYGSGLNWSGLKAPLAANTTYYFCNYTVGPYGSSSPDGAFFYNDMNATLSLSVNVPSTAGAGGAGGVGQGFTQSAGSGSAGASGGTNAGVGGNGGSGGALGVSGSSGASGATGTGTAIAYPSTAPTAGAAGTSAGAAGYYIQGESNVSLTNNGTVLGRTI
jgi:hypothetical protein